MKKVHLEHPGASRTRMTRPRIASGRADFFDEWDSVRNVTFKDGSRGERHVLNRIPAALINFMIPGSSMGRITRTDVGRKLTVDAVNDEITSYIE